MANKLATRTASGDDARLCCPSLTDAPLKEEDAIALREC